jgi:hypothetical protein
MKIKILALTLLSLFAINAQANDCDNRIGASECAPKENVSGAWLRSETHPVQEDVDRNDSVTYGDAYNSAPTYKSDVTYNSAPTYNYKSDVTPECIAERSCVMTK